MMRRSFAVVVAVVVAVIVAGCDRKPRHQPTPHTDHAVRSDPAPAASKRHPIHEHDHGAHPHPRHEHHHHPHPHPHLDGPAKHHHPY